MLSVEMLSEPVSVSDTHVSGAVVEQLDDGNVRVTLYITKPSCYGGIEHRVEYVFVIGQAQALSLTQSMMREAGYACCGAGRMKNRH